MSHEQPPIVLDTPNVAAQSAGTEPLKAQSVADENNPVTSLKDEVVAKLNQFKAQEPTGSGVWAYSRTFWNTTMVPSLRTQKLNLIKECMDLINQFNTRNKALAVDANFLKECYMAATFRLDEKPIFDNHKTKPSELDTVNAHLEIIRISLLPTSKQLNELGIANVQPQRITREDTQTSNTVLPLEEALQASDMSAEALKPDSEGFPPQTEPQDLNKVSKPAEVSFVAAAVEPRTAQEFNLQPQSEVDNTLQQPAVVTTAGPFTVTPTTTSLPPVPVVPASLRKLTTTVSSTDYPGEALENFETVTAKPQDNPASSPIHNSKSEERATELSEEIQYSKEQAQASPTIQQVEGEALQEESKPSTCHSELEDYILKKTIDSKNNPVKLHGSFHGLLSDQFEKKKIAENLNQELQALSAPLQVAALRKAIRANKKATGPQLWTGNLHRILVKMEKSASENLSDMDKLLVELQDYRNIATEGHQDKRSPWGGFRSNQVKKLTQADNILGKLKANTLTISELADAIAANRSATVKSSPYYQGRLNEIFEALLKLLQPAATPQKPRKNSVASV